MLPVDDEMDGVSDNSSLSPQIDKAMENVLRGNKLIADGDFGTTKMVVLIIGLVVAGLGVLANVVNVKTFLSMGINDGVTTIFLSISCSDLAYVSLTVVRNIAAIILAIEFDKGVWLLSVDPRTLAFFSDNSAFVMYTVSVLSCTFLAVARCMCVAKPLHFKNMFTKERCLKSLILMYLFPIACQTAVFANMGVKEMWNSGTNSSRPTLWLSNDREKVKDIVRLMLSFILPFTTEIVVVVCVGVMIIKLKESAQFRTGIGDSEKETGTTKLGAKDRQVIKQVVLISTIYIICNTYKIINSLWMSLDPRFDYGRLYQNTYIVMDHLKIVFESFNASVNIFVYYAYNSRFRSFCFSFDRDSK